MSKLIAYELPDDFLRNQRCNLSMVLVFALNTIEGFKDLHDVVDALREMAFQPENNEIDRVWTVFAFSEDPYNPPRPCGVFSYGCFRLARAESLNAQS